MDDATLAKYLGIENEPKCDRILAALTPEKRAVYERLADTAMQLNLWQAGLGPKPNGVIVCRDHKHSKA